MSPLRARYVRLRSRGFALAKELLYATLRWSGAAALVRNTVVRRRVAIVVYHNPTPEALERHLRYMARRANFIPLDLLVSALVERDWSRIPPKSVVVTVDDGHADNVRLVEIFRRHGVRPTVFLCSQIVGTGRRYWWTAVPHRDRRALMAAPNEERLRLLAERYGYTQLAENGGRQSLSVEELEQMRDVFDFGAHTRFHPALPRCTDEEARDEIALSRREVAALGGRDCRHFAYPNGLYGEREVELVQAAGFASARTIDTGWNDAATDPYRLRVLGIPDDGSVNALAAQLAGIRYLRDLVFVT